MSTDTLSEKQRIAIDAMADGSHRAAAARAAGVDKAQITRWCRNPDFVAALAAEREDRVGDLRRQLGGLGAQAIELLKVALDPKSTLDASTRNAHARIAFGILDRIGMAPGAVVVPEHPPAPAEVSRKIGSLISIRDIGPGAAE